MPVVHRISSSEETKRAIENNSSGVRLAASELTDKIREFEKFICDLPGRMETEVWTGQEGKSGFCLGVWRIGKDWRLSFKRIEEGDWVPLCDAPLSIKIQSATMLDDLMIQMHTNQTELIKNLVDAAQEYDRFMGGAR